VNHLKQPSFQACRVEVSEEGKEHLAARCATESVSPAISLTYLHTNPQNAEGSPLAQHRLLPLTSPDASPSPPPPEDTPSQDGPLNPDTILPPKDFPQPPPPGSGITGGSVMVRPALDVVRRRDFGGLLER
jgi:hypothetical protein